MASGSNSSSSSFRESRCWRIQSFKNNFGDLQQIDVDTLDSHDPLLHCNSPELVLRGKSPLRRLSSPSPTQSLAFTNILGTSQTIPVGARSPLLLSCSRSRDSNEFSRPATPRCVSPAPISFEHDLRPFCDCFTSGRLTLGRTLDGRTSDQPFVCECGESPIDNGQQPLWKFEAGNGCEVVRISSDGRQVQFHPGKVGSSGTAAVRASTSLAMDKQHFWELKLTSPLFGTDVMIGLGTDQVDLRKYEDRFCSMLGQDSESWGLSYSGLFQHAGETTLYAAGFTRGCIVGVHLDPILGELSFFLNRRPLGIACKATFKDRQLYPMVCSTTARSSIKLLRTRTCDNTLQYLACRRLRQLVPAHLHVLDALQPPLPPGLCTRLREQADWLLEPQRVLSTTNTGFLFLNQTSGQQSPASSGSRSPELSPHLSFKKRRLI